MRHDEYASQDGLSLAKLIQTGEVTATEVLKAAIARRNAVNPALNAVVESWDEEALAAADDLKGVFGGVPFLIKDMDGHLAGHRCTYSSRSLEDWVPQRSSELMVRFQMAGLNIFGKTNCPEFGIMGVSEPELRGPARNPWNLRSHSRRLERGLRGCGGRRHRGAGPRRRRGGSLRIPASHCGIFGLKTSRGLVPLGPDEAEAWDGMVSRLLMSRTVRDSAAALDAVRGSDPGAPYAAPEGPKSYQVTAARKPPKLRIGFSTRSIFGRKMHPDAIEAVDKAVSLAGVLGSRGRGVRPARGRPGGREGVPHDRGRQRGQRDRVDPGGDRPQAGSPQLSSVRPGSSSRWAARSRPPRCQRRASGAFRRGGSSPTSSDRSSTST
jgi:amidase